MNEKTITLKFKLQGLTCSACTKLTAKRIKQISGVKDAVVSLDTETAEVTAEREITKDEIAKVLEGTFYTVA